MKKAVFAPALAILALAAAVATPAVAQVYQYKDAQGNTVFSDRPPPGAQTREVAPASATQRRASAAPTVESAAEGLAADAAPTAEQEAADRALQERQEREAAAKAKEEAAANAAREKEREQQCTALASDIAGLESGIRIARFNSTTNQREYLGDVERAAELSRKKEQFQKHCVPGER